MLIGFLLVWILDNFPLYLYIYVFITKSFNTYTHIEHSSTFFKCIKQRLIVVMSQWCDYKGFFSHILVFSESLSMSVCLYTVDKSSSVRVILSVKNPTEGICVFPLVMSICIVFFGKCIPTNCFPVPAGSESVIALHPYQWWVDFEILVIWGLFRCVSLIINDS